MANTDDGTLVEAARAGDPQAFGRLFDAWFDRVHDLSRRILHDDGIAGEVAQDAFLTAWTKLGSLEDPDAFGGWLLRIARNASLNRLAREKRSVTTGDETMTVLTDASSPDHDPLERMDQASRIALVWEAAAALGPRDASVLDLHLRHGLTPAELAEELGVTPNHAHQVMFNLRKRLGNSVRALVLWRAGHPTCAALSSDLRSVGLTSFGAPMVRAIDRHVDGCADCRADRTERISPAALFAAAPIVVAPLLLKAHAAGALEAAGVPMSGSAASTAAGGTGTGSGTGASGGTGAGGGTGASGLGAGGGGIGDDGPTPDADEQAQRRRLTRRKLVVGAGLALVACLIAAVALAGQTGDDSVHLAATAGTTVPAAATAPTGVTTTVPTTVTLASTVPTSAPTATTSVAPPTTVPATVPTTTTAPAQPVIDSFTARVVAQQCAAGLLWNLAWSTTGATTVTIAGNYVKGQSYAANGSTSICSPRASTFTLTAQGPGGTATATAGSGSTPATTTTIVP